MGDKFKEESFKMGRRKLKKYENGFLYIFLVIFILGYAFFFLSPYIMPKTYEGVRVTDIGEVINANDRKITLDDWTYSKSQKAMEIVLEVENYSIDGIEEYRYEVRDRHKGYKTREVLNENGLVVIRAYKLPKDWTEIVLRVGISPEDQEKNPEFGTIKLYTNDLSVRNIEKIEDKTREGYLKDSYTLRITKYTDRIREIDQEIEEDVSQKAEADVKIAELQESMSLQTENEQKDTALNIADLNMIKDSMDNMISQLNEEKKDLEKKIEILNSKLKDLDEG